MCGQYGGCTMLRTPPHRATDLAALSPDCDSPGWVSKSARKIPVGTLLSVWWDSVQEARECIVVDYCKTASGAYTHVRLPRQAAVHTQTRSTAHPSPLLDDHQMFALSSLSLTALPLHAYRQSCRA